ISSATFASASSRRRSATAGRRGRRWWSSCSRTSSAASYVRPGFPPPSYEDFTSRSADVDPDRLPVGELVERVNRLFAAEARLLEAAERRRDVARVERVDPDDASPDRSGIAVSLADVTRPDCRREAVDRVVGDLERVLVLGEADRRQHRPEDLLLRDPHV